MKGFGGWIDLEVTVIIESVLFFIGVIS